MDAEQIIDLIYNEVFVNSKLFGQILIQDNKADCLINFMVIERLIEARYLDNPHAIKAMHNYFYMPQSDDPKPYIEKIIEKCLDKMVESVIDKRSLWLDRGLLKVSLDSPK